MGNKWDSSWTWRLYKFWVFNNRWIVTIITDINVPVRYKVWEEFEEFRAVSKVALWHCNLEWCDKEIRRKDRILRANWEVKERHIKPSKVWQFEGSTDKVKVKRVWKHLTCKIIISCDDLYGLALISVADKIR